jgi:hypothetical protein
MKKVLLLIALLALTCGPACAGTDEKTFAWEQPSIDTASPDFGGWKIFYSETAGGPYTVLTTINFTTAQATYTADVTLGRPEWNGTTKTLYFIARAFNKTTSQESDDSNEVSALCDFTNVFTVPINFRLKTTP